jgi:hypothetical protein
MGFFVLSQSRIPRHDDVEYVGYVPYQYVPGWLWFASLPKRYGTRTTWFEVHWNETARLLKLYWTHQKNSWSTSTNKVDSKPSKQIPTNSKCARKFQISLSSKATTSKKKTWNRTHKRERSICLAKEEEVNNERQPVDHDSMLSSHWWCLFTSIIISKEDNEKERFRRSSTDSSPSCGGIILA